MTGAADWSSDRAPDRDAAGLPPRTGQRDPAIWSLHRAAVSGRSLLEWSEYDDIALWWFVHPDFVKLLMRLSYDVRLARPSVMQANTPAFVNRGDSLLRAGRLPYRLLSRALGRLLSTDMRQAGGGLDRILIVSQNNLWRPVRDPRDGVERPGDAFFQPIMRELGRGGDHHVVTCYPLIGPPDSWYYPLPGVRKILRRVRDTDVPHIILDSHWSSEVWRKARRARRHFQSLWGKRVDPEELRHLVPGGADAFGEVVRRLGYYFNTVFGRTVALLEMAGRLLEAERPDLVLLITEYGRFERATVIGARLRGIPVLALQHGVIHPHHPGYMFSEDEVSGTGSVRFPYYPLPDLTAVYGPYDRELLTEVSAYPPEGVVVTGHPRYDLLASAEKWYQRDEVLRQLHLDPARPTVLWTTQTHGLSREENKQNVQAVYGAVRNLNEAQLVLKLHPVEDQRAGLYRFVPGYRPVIVDRKGDTFALLFACDLLITRYSTTAMEAIALGKPVIILNLSGTPDLVDYAKDGVAEGVYRPEDLEPAIERLLSDSTHLSKKRDQYIAKYLFKADGRATARVVGLIEQMVET